MLLRNKLHHTKILFVQSLTCLYFQQDSWLCLYPHTCISKFGPIDHYQLWLRNHQFSVSQLHQSHFLHHTENYQMQYPQSLHYMWSIAKHRKHQLERPQNQILKQNSLRLQPDNLLLHRSQHNRHKK